MIAATNMRGESVKFIVGILTDRPETGMGPMCRSYEAIHRPNVPAYEKDTLQFAGGIRSIGGFSPPTAVC
ncbi:MAG: hypothetical protein C0483_12705 [Pirellula sp.]|nr:hypothetical protein [Pirellula sp.]